ncbi:MAG: DJ-1/PfpI family protein [Hyphomicrobiales bacterium]|nr:DJ-1/PfpI family protein [Hyphomicrobiales bacterium]MCP5372784.1 DJ-1/PfpI family protein [Hyphomicrobiales bacterium]
MKKHTIGLFLFNHAEELDFVGPFEVFTMVNEVARHRKEDEPNQVVLISETGADIRGAKGMRVGVHCAMADAPPLDVFCIPGGDGTRALIRNRAVLDWVAAATRPCTWITSVCTGSFVLAAAGPAKGRRVTTHWATVEELRALDLGCTVTPGERYVQDGNLVTAAGVSAGIDMALWLTGQMYGEATARHTQKAMEYDPAPPYGRAA